MFDGIKSALFGIVHRALSIKDSDETIVRRCEMIRYENKLFYEYLSEFNEDNYEFLRLISVDNLEKGYSGLKEKYQILEDFKNLIKGKKENTVIMKELVSDPSKRGKQLLKDLGNYRKRFDELYNDLELCAKIYNDPTLGDNVDFHIMVEIFLTIPVTKEIRDLKIKYGIVL